MIKTNTIWQLSNLILIYPSAFIVIYRTPNAMLYYTIVTYFIILKRVNKMRELFK